MTRLYLLPKVGTGVAGDELRPAHLLDLPALAGITWSAVDGATHMVVAVDATGAQHAVLAGQPGALPLDFDAEWFVGQGDVATLRPALDAAGLMAVRITAGAPWRATLRAIVEELQPGLRGKRIVLNGVEV